MTHLPDMPVFIALCDEYGVKDSAPEELKAECRSDKYKYDRSSNRL